ncbi:unnamed protein product [Allacma fusca]|uniref:Uncharacterized protein n=1 Tax=Allacma fusca TaxID=39272 RepID=A0A8J2NRI0_9HEXA|nr:unnamed protein product [Allacma fusca]
MVMAGQNGMCASGGTGWDRIGQVAGWKKMNEMEHVRLAGWKRRNGMECVCKWRDGMECVQVAPPSTNPPFYGNFLQSKLAGFYILLGP